MKAPGNQVIVRMLGGLGNQMFQYATARALSERYHAALLLDTTSFIDYDLRRFELGEFPVAARVASDEELAAFSVQPTAPKSLLARLKRRFQYASPALVFREASFVYDNRIEDVRPPVLLDGYWQSERYFANIAGLLRSELGLPESSLSQPNQDMLAQIRDAGSHAVSLHVRRGDYVSNPGTAAYHGVCSTDYYRAAMQWMAERVDAPHFFVFSDDPQWVLENLSTSHATTFVQINDADSGIFDLALMKSCRHHVIANSSFSWWGAWLNAAPEKMVVAPASWFAKAGHDTSDLIPSSWVRL